MLPCIVLAHLFGCSDHRLTYKVDTGDTADTDAEADADTDTDTDTDTDSDTDTDTDADTDTVPPRTVCDRILVYSTATSREDDAFGAFAGLPDDPALTTWDVDVAERGDTAALTESLLEDYSQLWIVGTDADLGNPFDFDEVRAVRDFVELGGGVLLASGAEDTSSSYADDLALLAELYGVTLEGERREADDGVAVRVTDTDPTLLAGVSELPGFASVGELTLTDSAVHAAGEIGGAPALAWRDDGSRIVFDRAWQGWTDTWRATADQPTLVGNVAGFLEPCSP